MSRPAGFKQTPETKDKIRKAITGIKRPSPSQETIEKRKASRKGYHHTQETIDKIVASRSWYTHTDETKQKISKAHIGLSVTDEFRESVSKRFKGKPLSEEHRQKLITSHIGSTGYKFTEEQKEKLRLSHKGTRGFHHSKESKEKMSKSTAEWYLKNNVHLNKHFKIGYFFSVKNDFQNILYRSSYELKAYILLEKDDSVLFYKAEPFKIKYLYEGMIKYTVPDILVTYKDLSQKLIEVKPKYQLKDKRVKARMKAYKNHAKKNNMIFEHWHENTLGIH
ncbi:NUMOD3 domain-containing DNA-binding protein [Candidatus Pacearchaeota archaeon]|jgi:hypothetical protein|nr:NUMOD3 domain-containing DNA-binding protein [Candidatus Pacearchaeota archaeon]